MDDAVVFNMNYTKDTYIFAGVWEFDSDRLGGRTIASRNIRHVCYEPNTEKRNG